MHFKCLFPLFWVFNLSYFFIEPDIFFLLLLFFIDFFWLHDFIQFFFVHFLILRLVNSLFSIFLIFDTYFHLDNSVVKIFRFVIWYFAKWNWIKIVEDVVGSIWNLRCGVGECIVEFAAFRTGHRFVWKQFDYFILQCCFEGRVDVGLVNSARYLFLNLILMRF